MAEHTRKDEGMGSDAERQGVREPQEPDLDSRREIEPSDIAQANEERTSGEPATGPREPQEPRSAHTEGRARHEHEESPGMLDRVRSAWNRMRHHG